MTKQTKDRILRFNVDRDWTQFHSEANLAKSIMIEAGELLECFQWNDKEFKKEKVEEELADVLIYCQDLLMKLGLDEEEIVNKKLDQNEAKYPIEKSKGNAKKYTEF